jgi:hypothetical protein
MVPVARHTIIERVRAESGKDEKTEILIDYLEDMWETIDFLKKMFGNERAEEIIAAVSACNFTPDEYPHT